LGVIDSFTRQCLALEVATSFPSRRVTRVLERAIAAYGKPQSIRSENGPELTSRHYLAWAIEWKIDLVHIQPGKPTQNGGMESFNGKLRDECLNTSWFWNLFDARKKISLGKRNITRAARTARLPTERRTSSRGSGRLLLFQKRSVWPRISPVKATLTGSASLRP
jgi:transposase InsO family protein